MPFTSLILCLEVPSVLPFTILLPFKLSLADGQSYRTNHRARLPHPHRGRGTLPVLRHSVWCHQGESRASLLLSGGRHVKYLRGTADVCMDLLRDLRRQWRHDVQLRACKAGTALQTSAELCYDPKHSSKLVEVRHHRTSVQKLWAYANVNCWQYEPLLLSLALHVRLLHHCSVLRRARARHGATRSLHSARLVPVWRDRLPRPLFPVFSSCANDVCLDCQSHRCSALTFDSVLGLCRAVMRFVLLATPRLLAVIATVSRGAPGLPFSSQPSCSASPDLLGRKRHTLRSLASVRSVARGALVRAGAFVRAA